MFRKRTCSGDEINQPRPCRCSAGGAGSKVYKILAADQVTLGVAVSCKLGLFHIGEWGVRWHRLNTLRVVQNTLARFTGRVGQHPASHARGDARQRIRGDRTDCTQRIAVNPQHLFSFLRKADSGSGAECCFSNTALLADNDGDQIKDTQNSGHLMMVPTTMYPTQILIN